MKADKIFYLGLFIAALPVNAIAGNLFAKAVLEPKSGSSVSGTLNFSQQGEAVLVTGTVTGLTPGKHGFHVHEKGDCSAADASSAGDHFNPTSSTHGAPSDSARHAGDLGNIEADQTGTAKINITDKGLSLTGESTIVGRSVVVHKETDDLKTQPSGNSGQKVACGVIKGS